MDIAVLLFKIRQLLWGGPLLVLIVSVGIYLTYALNAFQFRYIFKSIKLLLFPPKQPKEGTVGDLSPFQSIMTALAGAIGTGSIAGVAIAISIGGYGALFWLWLTSLFGMLISFSENVLAIKFRVQNKAGDTVGGPMYTLEHGVKSHLLAKSFAVLGAVAAFGIGATVQSNSVASALNHSFGTSTLVTGAIMACIASLIVIGGVKSIGRVASILVPFMSILYMGASIIILCSHASQLKSSFLLIFNSALSGQAAVGGFIGSSVLLALQMGVARSIFSSEAGLGSSPIAAASAKTPHPVEQGMLAMAGVFVSTIIICTVTGLVIVVTNSLGLQGATGEVITGAQLTINAFNQGLKGSGYIVILCLLFFGFTTTLTWAYYGEKCIEYIFSRKSVKFYRALYLPLIIIGATTNIQIVWAYADIANGLMALPNLLSILFLTHVLKKEVTNYLSEK